MSLRTRGGWEGGISFLPMLRLPVCWPGWRQLREEDVRKRQHPANTVALILCKSISHHREKLNKPTQRAHPTITRKKNSSGKSLPAFAHEQKWGGRKWEPWAKEARDLQTKAKVFKNTCAESFEVHFSVSVFESGMQ